MKHRHSVKPYYAYSQRLTRAENRHHNQNTSSLEFWKWLDDKCTQEERAYINDGRTGKDAVFRCKQIIASQGGWANVNKS